MNGIHDLGGMHGFGRIEREGDEPVFHHDWEKRVMGLFLPLAARGLFNVDEFRHAIERMGAAAYLQTSYYEHWLHAFETLAVEKGAVTAEELRQARAVGPSHASPALAAADVPAALARGASARVDTEVKPKFKEGDMVVVKNMHPVGHTRLPRYVRDKLGCIDRDHGVFVFPDAAAHGKAEKPQHCYSVYFSAQELWGSRASRNDSVFVDLWDDYLVPA
ncbi:MAG: nitrile hydratase subunit beta [Gammaproteobacteria bacterium]|nr:nitrile hydratase subunit beta [Gammaproteobacteria bacterium]